MSKKNEEPKVTLPAPTDRKPVEAWAAELGTESWLFAATKMRARWPVGRELTRAEYEAEVKAALEVTCR